MQNITNGVSVVIPIFNSGGTLPTLVEKIFLILPELHKNFELVLVNDGSQDNSWQVIEEICEKHSWVRGICLMRNYGQHNATLAGIRSVKYSITVTLDDDLQHPPSQIPKLINKCSDGFDVIYGTPLAEPHGFLRGLASQILKISLRHALGAEASRNGSAFRDFRTHLRDGFKDFNSTFVSVDVLLSWSTKHFGSVKVPHLKRDNGESNYSLFQLLQHALTLITGYSVFPLQLASFLGFLITGFGFMVLLYVSVNFFINENSVPGFPFLASIIAIFSGAQMFSLGIIGEYLARMHFRLMNKPVYFISKKIR
jgi:undecaprenyl-phosphate 4-deoxy-4-formamido-L-arabinose transferase